MSSARMSSSMMRGTTQTPRLVSGTSESGSSDIYRCRPAETDLCSLRALGLENILFVRRRAVHTWNLYVVETKEDAQLGTVVDQVIQDRAAHDCCTRHGHYGVSGK